MSRVHPAVVRVASLLPAVLLGLLAMFSPAAAVAQTSKAAYPQALPYTVTTVAGGGTLGNMYPGTATAPVKPVPFTVGAACATGSPLTANDVYGDGCLATQVLIGFPRAVASDSEGNIFLTDADNQLIRRVDARTGVITTIAGTAPGTPGEPPQGTNPGSGAACPTGSGTTTSANGDGCLATGVYLAAPEGITVDAAGNVWFTDYLLGSVREVNKATGIITTLVNTAGTLGYKSSNISNPAPITPAAAQLYNPYGLAFDKNGLLYIVDEGNDVVDIVNFGSGAVTAVGLTIPANSIFTIAGSGCAEGSTTSCDKLKDYGKTGNGLPSTSSTLDTPYQVALDNSGNVYIADEFPYDVRVINGSTGILTTYANGNFTKLSGGVIVNGPAISTSLANVYGVATGPYGDVYIATYDSTSTSSYIARVDAATSNLYVIAGEHSTAAPTTPGGGQAGATPCTGANPVGDHCPGLMANFYKTYEPATDAAGNVYVVDQGNGLIRKISTGTQFPATAVGTTLTQTVDLHFTNGDTFASATLASSPDFTLAVGAGNCTSNTTVNTQDCLATVSFKPSAPGIRTAALTVTGTKGMTNVLTLSGTGTGSALTLDPGTQATVSSSATAVTAIAIDTAGNTYAALPGASTILKVTASNASSMIGSGLTGATSVAVDGSGNVYVAIPGSVVEIPASGAQTTIGSGFTTPAGLAVDGFGNVYVADSSANTVSEILAGGSGVQITLATGLNGPSALAVDQAGNVYVANSVGNTVVELPFNGSAQVQIGSGLSAPSGVAVDAAGSVYVADSKNQRIVYIPYEGGKFTADHQIAIVSSGLTSPSGVALAGNGTLYVADKLGNAVYSYTRTAAAYGFGNDQVGTQLSEPADILSSGNATPTFNTSAFATASAGSSPDLTITPTATPASTSFPAAGYGVPLTAYFTASNTGARSSTYTFGGTTSSLTLTGTGIKPVDATTNTITATPTSGTYGQTVAVTITIAVAAGLPAPTGTVTVKVDSSTYMPTLSAAGTATLSLPGLSAGTHTITSSYPGDTLSQPSTATPVTVTLAKAPLTITPNSINKVFNAPVPTLTGVLTGVVNGDSIGVTYTSAVTQTSPLGTYPITVAYSGTAVANYTVTVVPGAVTVVKAPSTTVLTTSAASVNSSTQVVLTATVSGSSSGGASPTGSVTFLSGSSTLGTATLSSTGVATLTTSFATVGAVSNYAVTAAYGGDANFASSNSAALAIASGVPVFSVTPSASTVSVAQGQSGLLSFNLTPSYLYAGAINFTCTGLPATVSCAFSPSTLTANGTNTPYTIALNINTVQPGPLSRLTAPAAGLGPGLDRTGSVMLAALPWFGMPSLALLFGFSRKRRKALGRYRALMLLAVLGLLGMGLSGCGAGPSTAGTPVGPYTVTVVATGASITQQFSVAVTVHQ